MTFDVAATAYDAFMGRYSAGLVGQMADLAGVVAAQRALDVGCGPGALTAELVRRLGPANVAAVDPSEPFVEAARERQPDVDIRLAAAESLPFGDGEFDAALAQLVVHFMDDPVAGLREMARVTRAGGVVAACVWDFDGGRSPLSPFWTAALQLDPDAVDESRLSGARRGHLVELLGAAGLRAVTEHELRVSRRHASFEEWWQPFAGGVGPAGGYLAGLDNVRREALRERCRALLPSGSFTLESIAWAARGFA
jgi:SAM-dependent methyltransferase